MRQQWRVWCCLAWVLWMAKTSGGVVTWSPCVRSPSGICTTSRPSSIVPALEAFRVGHPAMAPRVPCLPMGVRPQ